ncbi:MAG: hypothetical protein AB2813_02415 [Candidatus Sedimenticola endophacoides]
MTDQSISATVKNLESAFAGESMANRKYLYFARRCRELGGKRPIINTCFSPRA